MTNIVIKRVYEAASPADGLRILVDRLWPRGLSKEKAALDTWNKELAPSPALRKWFDHAPERFEEFRHRYESELAGNPAITEALAAIGKGKATLLYAAKDPAINHAVVLVEFMRRARR